MVRSRADEILEGWNLIAHSEPRTAYAPRSGHGFVNAAAGLLLAAAAAIVVLVAVASRAPGSVGGQVGPATSSPTAEVTPTASASATALSDAHSGPQPTPPIEPSATPTPNVAGQQTPSPEDTQAARDYLNRYLANLVAGRYAEAYAMLAPTDRAMFTLASFQVAEAEFFRGLGGQYTIAAWPDGVTSIMDWATPDQRPHIDLAHAVLLRVDYPALAGNNAGWNMYVVNRTANGTLEIYSVR